MSLNHIDAIADEFALKPSGVKACVELLKQDATIPFIARYRKEVTGSLDEVQITAVQKEYKKARKLYMTAVLIDPALDRDEYKVIAEGKK